MYEINWKHNTKVCCVNKCEKLFRTVIVANVQIAARESDVFINSGISESDNYQTGKKPVRDQEQYLAIVT